VEVDETYVGGLEVGVRGRQTETKALVAIACEQDQRIEIAPDLPLGRRDLVPRPWAQPKKMGAGIPRWVYSVGCWG